jgi:hypothetical protein
MEIICILGKTVGAILFISSIVAIKNNKENVFRDNSIDRHVSKD